MKTKVTLHFYAKSTKANTSGQYPIYVRLTVNGKRLEFSSKKFIDSSKWSTEQIKMKGNSEEARSINNYLDLMKSKVFNIQMELIHKNQELNIENFKNELFGLTVKSRMLMPIFHDHNNRMKELLGKEYAPGTLERYKTSLSHTKDFLIWKFNVSDIDISRIDFAFITDYEFYLRSVRNCANNTTVKYLKNFQKIIKICLDNEWITKNPFVNFKSKVKEVERIFLSDEEIQIIMNKDFSIERLSLVRDLFLFSCYTGLAYADVRNLTKSNINIGIDGEKWIYTHRQKTDTLSKIPLLPYAQYIIDKYESHPVSLNQNKLLPILTNQRMNSYLKEIGDLCQINKELTFHVARHTFATTITLSNGVPIESVCKMLGHTNLKTTQHYAKVVDKKISQDMEILKQKFMSKDNVGNINAKTVKML